MLNDLAFLRTLRRYEVRQVARELPPACRLLEVGAGAGNQARLLSELGHRVEAIDIASSGYLAHAEFPVQVYDGRVIPFADASFDAVFSSNVLEHVEELPALLAETRRVLVPGGLAVHVLPTPIWRLWTSLAHYPWLLTFRWRRSGGAGGAVAGGDAPHSWTRRLRLALASQRHGEDGSALWELYGFSRWRWRRSFRSAGFDVVRSYPTRLFCTGYGVLGPRLSLGGRRGLSRLLGSSTRIFVLRALR